MTPPAFSELAAVASVAARKNFRAAANDLGVSASALSHAVASLEARLGVRLFNRTTRSVSLTAVGAQFLARVEPAMRAIADAMRDANEQRATPAGIIRINAAEIAGEQGLACLIPKFLERYPDMQVELVSEGRLVDIVAGGFDAGLRVADMVPLDMVAVPVGPELRHIVVGAPAYFANRSEPCSPLDLKDHACIRFRLPGGALYRWEFKKRDEELTVEVGGRLTLDSTRMIMRAAMEGAGLAYVNEWLARDALADGRLRQVLSDWTPTYPGLCLYYPKHRHMSAGMLAFVKMLLDEVIGTRD